MSLLGDIVERTRADLAARQARVPSAELRRRAGDMPPPKSLKDALSGEFAIIGEIKRRSPTGGEMDPANAADALQVYNDSPVIAAISVLTDEPFFGGSLERLLQVRRATGKPILRKDFIVDEYQVWEARAFGADAVLLMGAVHEKDPARLNELYQAARSLGLQALFEIGMSEAGPERQAAIAPRDAEIWGVNSRTFHASGLDLRTRAGKLLGHDLSTSRSRHRELRGLVPPGKIVVAESGIHQPAEIDELVELRYNAALIGTAFLKSGRRIADVVSAFADHVAELRRAAAGAKPVPA